MKLTKESEKLTDLKTLKGTKVFPNVKDANVPESIQRKLTAGKNITIDNNVISATDQQPDLSGYQKKLTAGTGIEITSSNVINNTQPSPDLSGYQKKLTAGEHITISDTNVISATIGRQPIIVTGEGSFDEADPFVFDKPITKEEYDNSTGDIMLYSGDELGYIFSTINIIHIPIMSVKTEDGTINFIFNIDDNQNIISVYMTKGFSSGYNIVTRTSDTSYTGRIAGKSINIVEGDSRYHILSESSVASDLAFDTSVIPSQDPVLYLDTYVLGKITRETYTSNTLNGSHLFSSGSSKNLLLTSYTHTIRIKSGTENLDVILTADTDDSTEIVTLPALCSVLSGNTLACHGHITGATKTPILIEIQDDSFIVYYQNNQDDTGAQESATFTVSDTPEITDRVRSHNVQVMEG